MLACRRRACSRTSSDCCSCPTLAELMLQELDTSATWMRRISGVAVLLAFAVVVVGAYVRLTTAGLGCPDWPGCYGHLTPVTAVNAGRAWREMVHRYLAGPLGMLTVTWQVAPQIVTLHLLFGMTTLALLWWLWLTLAARTPRTALPALGRSPPVGWAPSNFLSRRLAVIGLIALVVQIALGGWTSTNYAATACPDFPTCQASWWPSMDFGSAFSLWHSPTVNYEGGVFSNAARIAIHFTHRLGAIVASVALLLAAIWILRQRNLPRVRFAAVAVLAALVLQLTIGIAMVVNGFPVWLATAHHGGAALLLLGTLALNHRLWAGAR